MNPNAQVQNLMLKWYCPRKINYIIIPIIQVVGNKNNYYR